MSHGDGTRDEPHSNLLHATVTSEGQERSSTAKVNSEGQQRVSGSSGLGGSAGSTRAAGGMVDPEEAMEAGRGMRTVSSRQASWSDTHRTGDEEACVPTDPLHPFHPADPAMAVAVDLLLPLRSIQSGARTDSIIGKLRDRSSADLVHDLALWLPLHVIADMVGVPEGDREQVFGWTETTFGFDPSVTDADRQQAVHRQPSGEACRAAEQQGRLTARRWRRTRGAPAGRS